MNRCPVQLSGVILAGGQSRRMGQDKAFVPFDGKPLIEHVLTGVAAVADDLVIVTNAPAKVAHYAARVVTDIYPGTGVLGGLLTGLIEAECFYSLVVACDMPFLNIDLLRYMADQAQPYDVVIPFVGRHAPLMGTRMTAKARDLHPLHAIYSRDCRGAIENALARGDRRAISFLSDVRVRYIDKQEIERFDPDHRSLFNANTPQDLDRARRLKGVGLEAGG